MKKTFINIALLMFLTVSTTSVMASENNPALSNMATSEISAEVKIMLNRLEEIKEIDKSTLNPAERKELRKEVKTIKKELKGKGIYLSTGAIIIIVLLILIL